MRRFWVATMLLLATALPAGAAAGDRQCIACPRPIPAYGTWASYTIDGKKHLLHTDDPAPPACRYCSGLMTPYSPWGKPVKYADGRLVCQPCAKSAINDPKTAQAVMNRVRATMTGWGMQFPWKQIPVSLVGQSDLVRRVAKDHPGLKPDGVCQPELSKRLLSDAWKVTNLNIYMLTGLPRVQYERTAAHELTHAWMALAGCPRDQAPAFREGACNLAAYFYLQATETPAATRLRHWMLKDEDPVYGEGLRRHVRYAQAHRVRGTLAILKTHQDFPPGY